MSNLMNAKEQSHHPRYFSRGRYPFMSIVAERLHEVMSRRGIDQSMLARAVGVTQGTISLILRGKTQQSKHLPTIAEKLGIEYRWLVGETEFATEEEQFRKSLAPDQVAFMNALGAMTLRSLTNLADNMPDNWRSLFSVMFGDTLPPERALVAMFEALLAGIDPTASRDEQALLLAQRLPIGLSQLRDLLPDDKTPARELADALAGDPTPDRPPPR